MMKRGLGGEFRDRRFSPQATPNHHSSPSKLDSCTCKVLFGSVIECFQTMVEIPPCMYASYLSTNLSRLNSNLVYMTPNLNHLVRRNLLRSITFLILRVLVHDRWRGRNSTYEEHLDWKPAITANLESVGNARQCLHLRIAQIPAVQFKVTLDSACCHRLGDDASSSL